MALLRPFVELLLVVLNLYMWVILIWVVMSWLTAFNVINRFNPVVSKISEILFRLTDPILRRIRPYMPNLGGIDISPIVMLLGIYFIERCLIHWFLVY